MLKVLVLALVLVNIALLGLRFLDRPEEDSGTLSPVQSRSVQVPAIRLLSEAGDPALSAAGTAECFTAGPFAGEAAAAAALREIARSSVAITERRTEAEVQRGTWVYLPVQPDYVTARNMALTLQDAGFEEANVIMAGEWKHSVSLGYFVNEANAQERYTEARSLGFKVEQREELALEPRYWIDYEQRTGAPYVRPGADSAIGFAQHRIIPCVSAAVADTGRDNPAEDG